VGSNPITRSIVPDRGSCLGSKTISHLLSRYEVAARAAGLSQATITHTTRCVTYFARYLGNVEEVQRVGADEFRFFLSGLRSQRVWEGTPRVKAKPLSPTTVNTYARAIRAFWGWLEREGLIRKNALKAVPAPRLPRRLPRAFSEDEVRKILHSAENRPRDRAMVQLLLDSGVRLSELVGLTVPDLDLRLGRLRVYGKGGKERYAYFSNRTAEALKRYISTVRPRALEEDRLFLNIDGTPMDKRRVSKVLEVVGRHAGISQRLSAHKLRHTFATLSLRFGNNLEYLRLALGHADIETTSKSYLAASDADVAIAQRRSSPMANIYK